MITTAVDLYWLPLGAGGHCVRHNGRVYEAVSARIEHRPPRDLYHSALEIRIDGAQFVIESAPESTGGHGRVAGGPVGTRWAGRLRLFRYEVRRWQDGHIPDVAEAVESPVHVSDDETCARRLLELVPQVPTPVWGRDELRTGDMWNSNSIIAWLLACSCIDTDGIDPPAGGRAPGWTAGLVVAARHDSPGADPWNPAIERVFAAVGDHPRGREA